MNQIEIPRNALSGEQFITLPRRGLNVIAPPAIQDVLTSIEYRRKNHIRLTPDGRKTLWTPEQKARLNLLLKCKILARRFPEPQNGEEFMHEVDYQRRTELFGYVEELTEHIVVEWKRMNPDKEIAVVLFGSIAKGLVKSRFHPDPSNIDMTIVGDFTNDEKGNLFDAIRDKREEIAGRIRQSSPNLDYSIQPMPGNVGIYIQNPDTLSKDNYGETKVYLASGAFALYDPIGIWANLEREAIRVHSDKLMSRSHKIVGNKSSRTLFPAKIEDVH